MRREYLLVVVHLILLAPLLARAATPTAAPTCNQDTGTACVVGQCWASIGVLAAGQHCVGFVADTWTAGSCYCTDTCFESGACVTAAPTTAPTPAPTPPLTQCVDRPATVKLPFMPPIDLNCSLYAPPDDYVEQFAELAAEAPKAVAVSTAQSLATNVGDSVCFLTVLLCCVSVLCPLCLIVLFQCAVPSLSYCAVSMCCALSVLLLCCLTVLHIVLCSRCISGVLSLYFR